jgi:hypothetical protein
VSISMVIGYVVVLGVFIIAARDSKSAKKLK